MERLSDDLVILISRFINDPADLAHLALTCRRAYALVNPAPFVLSHKAYALQQQPFFLQSARKQDDGAIWTTRQAGMQSSSSSCLPSCLFGRFQRTRVLLKHAAGSGAVAETQYGLAWKVGQPEEFWTIQPAAAADGLVTLQVHGTATDCRGWPKARDSTNDLSPKGLQMDDLGKCFVSRQQGAQPGASVRLTLLSAARATWPLVLPPPLQALSIPVIPKPLFSYAGKTTVFEPEHNYNNFDFWKLLPPPSPLQVVVEFDCTLEQGIFKVHARGMDFSVAIPVLVEDALQSYTDYRYFLLHLFRRNSGRWETLLTYFMHAVRRILPPHPALDVRAAKAQWPTEHRDHSYEIWNDSFLFIHVKDGVIDKGAPRILPVADPWRLFLCYV